MNNFTQEDLDQLLKILSGYTALYGTHLLKNMSTIKMILRPDILEDLQNINHAIDWAESIINSHTGDQE